MPITTITPQQAYEQMQQGAHYIDVRTPEEFAAGHPAGAVNVPAFLRVDGMMMPNEDFVEQCAARLSPQTPILCGCQAGGRSAQACEWLAGAGYTNLCNVDGGFGGRRSPSGGMAQIGWKDAGLPVE